MVFRFIRPGFTDTGAVYTGTVTGRYLNGYRVERNGDVGPVLFEDIQVIEITEEERNAPMLW